MAPSDKRLRELKRRESAFSNLVIFFLLVKIALLFIPDPALEALDEIDKDVSIEIQGALMRPGIYRIPKGSSLHQLIEEASPHQDAALPKERLLDASKRFVIASKKALYVRFTGAVKEPGYYRFPKTWTLNQALAEISLTPYADLRGLALEKKLRHGKTYFIPEAIPGSFVLNSLP